MRPVRRPSSPRRRRPRDPRIAGSGPAADQAARQLHPDSQTPSARTLADASAKGRAVETWHAARPRVIDARTGRPPAKSTHRYTDRTVTVTHDPTLKPGPPPSPWSR
jgi:hypothetical protein